MPGSGQQLKKLSLENGWLRVEVLPELGGNISSLFAKESSTEFLLQPSRPYSHPTRETKFEDADRSGWDECLPTVSATPDAPDHGDLWRESWRVVETPQGIELSCDCFSRPLRLTRTLTLETSMLNVIYRVENLSSEPVDFLWCAHPLLAVSAGDRVVLPSSVDRVRINSSRNQRLSGDEVPWPIASGMNLNIADLNIVDLSIVGSPDARTADKLFAGPLTANSCGIYRMQTHTGLLFRSHLATISYAGIWLCNGGWPEKEVGTERAAHTVAIEPTTSPCDSLDQAIKEGTAARIGPRGSLGWAMQLQTLAVSFQGFVRACNHPDNILL